MDFFYQRAESLRTPFDKKSHSSEWAVKKRITPLKKGWWGWDKQRWNLFLIISGEPAIIKKRFLRFWVVLQQSTSVFTSRPLAGALKVLDFGCRTPRKNAVFLVFSLRSLSNVGEGWKYSDYERNSTNILLKEVLCAVSCVRDRAVCLNSFFLMQSKKKWVAKARPERGTPKKQICYWIMSFFICKLFFISTLLLYLCSTKLNKLYNASSHCLEHYFL